MAGIKAPKPTQVFVEVDSDEESQEPRLHGALRGLNPEKNIIRDETAAPTIEDSESGSELEGVKPSPVKHTTRASRGNAQTVNYDMKYHPMDVVTRPNSAAVRRQSKSVSFANSDDDESGEEVSLSSSPGSSGSDSSVTQDDDASEAPVQRIKLTPRTPDPRAVRHSSRRAARKPVIYSSKHHPQDHGLPGYRHRAIEIEDDDSDDDTVPQPSSKRSASVDEAGEISSKTPRAARKKLRTIDRSDEPPKPKRGRGRPKKAKSTAPKPAVSKKWDKEASDLANEAVGNLPNSTQATQRPIIISSQGTQATSNDGAQGDHEMPAEVADSDEESDDDSNASVEELLVASKSAAIHDRANSSQTLDRTPPTSVTSAGTPAGQAQPPSKLLEPSQLPTFVRDRIGSMPVTEATVAQLFLDDFRHVEEQAQLTINKPYLNDPNASPHLQNTLSLSQLPDVDQPYCSFTTPTSNEFEEAMAITEGHSDPDAIDDLPGWGPAAAAERTAESSQDRLEKNDSQESNNSSGSAEL